MRKYASMPTPYTMKFIIIVWLAFLARHRPASTTANPACMNMIRKPQSSVQREVDADSVGANLIEHVGDGEAHFRIADGDVVRGSRQRSVRIAVGAVGRLHGGIQIRVGDRRPRSRRRCAAAGAAAGWARARASVRGRSRRASDTTTLQRRARSSLSWSPHVVQAGTSLVSRPVLISSRSRFLIRGSDHAHDADQADRNADENHAHPPPGAVGDAKADKGNYETQKRDGESDERHICILLNHDGERCTRPWLQRLGFAKHRDRPRHRRDSQAEADDVSPVNMQMLRT